MKKLKLQALGLSANDILTREQMKKIVGGDGGSGFDGCSMHCDCGGCIVLTGCTTNPSICNDNFSITCDGQTIFCFELCAEKC